jgi:hypothetical protein
LSVALSGCAASRWSRRNGGAILLEKPAAAAQAYPMLDKNLKITFGTPGKGRQDSFLCRSSLSQYYCLVALLTA